MVADIFSLVVLACTGVPSASTCTVKSFEQPVMITVPQCEAMATKLMAGLTSHGSETKVLAHHCLKLPELFGSAAPKLAENAPAPAPTAAPKSAPAPAPAPHEDAPATDDWTHL